MKKKYIGAIDLGTTSTRFILFDHSVNIVSSHQIEHKQIYPQPGWVEHNPLQIWKNTVIAIDTTLKKAKIKAEEIAAIGITNQRETTVVWNPNTGKPYYNAIVWQDIRTDKICNGLELKYGHGFFRKRTGLPLTTYFSAPKIHWLLSNITGLKQAVTKDNAIFGTIDSWIIWQLSGGKRGGVHITDVTNASRTLMMNLKSLNWDSELLKIFEIPASMLPQIKPSIDSEIYAYTDKKGVLKYSIPICGDLGDQQAALFGQTCFKYGEAKNTYGTGCFLLLNTGEDFIYSKYGLLTTLAYKIRNQKAIYALEGSVANAGSLVQWFRDNLQLIKHSDEIESLARKVKDNGGIYFVPAFSGLFAPYWDSQARGLIVGLTHYINRNHIARSILESTAFQVYDIFMAMYKDSNIKLKSLKVDGGMTVNRLLMQFQSDILNIPIVRSEIVETTALGAAYAAGLAIGFWKNLAELKQNMKSGEKWIPKMKNEEREILCHNWQKAVKRTFHWL